MQWARALSFVAVAQLLTAAAVAEAQMYWDQDEYLGLVGQGEQAYVAATELPSEAVRRRHDLLLQSARAKANARRLLYFAIVTGEFQDAFDDAITEWFNLSENLIVTLIQLAECDASELILDEMNALRDRFPPDAVEYLETLPARIDACRAEVAPELTSWDPSRYERLSDDADSWLARSEQAEAGSSAQHDLLLESAWSREQSIDLLRATLFTYAVAPGLEDPVESLFVQYQPLIDALVRLGFCDVAERRLLQRRIDARVLGTEPSPPDTELSPQIERCRTVVGD